MSKRTCFSIDLNNAKKEMPIVYINAWIKACPMRTLRHFLLYLG